MRKGKSGKIRSGEGENGKNRVQGERTRNEEEISDGRERGKKEKKAGRLNSRFFRENTLHE